VHRPAARELIVASLLAMCDSRPGPLTIDAAARVCADEVELRFASRSSDRVAILSPASVYHALTWDDLAMLARDHGVACSHDGDAVLLRFPTAAP